MCRISSSWTPAISFPFQNPCISKTLEGSSSGRPWLWASPADLPCQGWGSLPGLPADQQSVCSLTLTAAALQFSREIKKVSFIQCSLALSLGPEATQLLQHSEFHRQLPILGPCVVSLRGAGLVPETRLAETSHPISALRLALCCPRRCLHRSPPPPKSFIVLCRAAHANRL